MAVHDKGGVVDHARFEAASVPQVKPLDLMIRCMVERTGDQWQAFTLEFGLAVQGESQAEVRRKLTDMIESYVRDALVGEDRKHAAALLARRATWPVYLRWYLAGVERFTSKFFRLSGERRLFREPLPLEPRHC
jgi:hypothetical protein